MKPQAPSLKQSLVISVYITACYYALMGGEAQTVRRCYNILTRDLATLDKLVQEGVVEKRNIMEGNITTLTILKCGPSEFSSRPPFKLLTFLTGLVVFFAILCVSMYVQSSARRGALILFSFVVVCFCVGSIQNMLFGLGSWPSTTVILTSFFYGALFWFIDNFTRMDFNSILEDVCGDTAKSQLTYDFAKFCWNAIGTLFLAICITLVWQISGTLQEQYGKAGVAGVMIKNAIWLTFWGSLGLLGIAGSEAAGRIWAVVKGLKTQSQKRT